MLKFTEEELNDDLAEDRMVKVEAERKSIAKELKVYEEKSLDIREKIARFRDGYAIGSMQDIDKALDGIIFTCSDLDRGIKTFASRVGYNLKDGIRRCGAGAAFTITRDGEATRIECDHLFPHKIKRWTKATDPDFIYNYYLPYLYDVLDEAGRTGKIAEYKEPVVFCLITHYAPGMKLVDHDNIEYSGFFDCIAMYLIPDDSPKWCSHYFDYEVGETEYSEIVVVPKRIFPEFLTDRLKKSLG